MIPFLSEPEASMNHLTYLAQAMDMAYDAATGNALAKSREDAYANELDARHAREDEIARLADEAAADIRADYERMVAQLTEWAKRLSYGGQELEGIGREIRAAQNDQRRPVHGISFDLEEHFYGQTDRLIEP